MNYVIGLDQGGSGTRAVVCDRDGRIIGTGNGRGACHVFTGMDAAMQATDNAVQAALAEAGMLGGRAQVFAGGYTGADWPDEYDLLRNAVQGLELADEVVIVNDSIAAMRGGTDNSYGAILVAGTGANCAVRSPDGREFIYHYYHDDDLQGGSAIGRAALKAIFRAKTGRPPQTSLSHRVLELFDLQDVDALMRNLIEGVIPSSRVPEIAPLVFVEAEDGDLAARQIVTHFGEGCAELLVNGFDRLEMKDLDLEIVISGGIFKSNSPLLMEILKSRITTSCPGAKLIHARYEPVVGAVILALEKARINLDPRVKSNIELTAKTLNLIRT